MISEIGTKIVGEAFVDLYIYRLITSPEMYEKLWSEYTKKYGFEPSEKAKQLVKEFHGYGSTRSR